jgi:hypothetical protein
MTLFLQCKNVVIAMPRKLLTGGTESFTITLPVQAIGMMENLISTGLFGSSRGEVARTLILSRLEQLVGKDIVKLPSAKP